MFPEILNQRSPQSLVLISIYFLHTVWCTESATHTGVDERVCVRVWVSVVGQTQGAIKFPFLSNG